MNRLYNQKESEGFQLIDGSKDFHELNSNELFELSYRIKTFGYLLLKKAVIATKINREEQEKDMD